MKKRDIYVVLSGGTPLHAVYTERQAKRFVESYGKPTENCLVFLGDLSWRKIKLIPPRKLKEKTKAGLVANLKTLSVDSTKLHNKIHKNATAAYTDDAAHYKDEIEDAAI